jgi:MFS family permease
MTSLAQAYHGDRGGPGRARIITGVVVFCVGAILVVGGTVATTTQLLYGTDPASLTAKRHLGGILAGLGVPAVILGIFTVLPSGRLSKAGAVIGAGIAAMGVALFAYAYPCQWTGSTCATAGADLTLMTVGLYGVGLLGTLWALFTGLATTKIRNDPGGTARIEVQKLGQTRYIPTATPTRTHSSVGVSGLQTPTPTTADGGTAAQHLRSPQPTDSVHCGTCARFEYRRTSAGIRPYCHEHAEFMDDLDPCDQYAPRQ